MGEETFAGGAAVSYWGSSIFFIILRHLGDRASRPRDGNFARPPPAEYGGDPCSFFRRGHRALLCGWAVAPPWDVRGTMPFKEPVPHGVPV